MIFLTNSNSSFVDPEEEAAHAETEALIHQSLRDAIADLPPELQEVIRLKFFTDVNVFVKAGAKKKAWIGEPGKEKEAYLSDENIASYLGEKYDVIHSRMGRALDLLKNSPYMAFVRNLLLHDAEK